MTFMRKPSIQSAFVSGCVALALGAGAGEARASTYVVVEGDTLSGIAARIRPGERLYGKAGTLAELRARNPGIKNPRRMRPGTVLRIPHAWRTTGPSVTPASAKAHVADEVALRTMPTLPSPTASLASPPTPPDQSNDVTPTPQGVIAAPASEVTARPRATSDALPAEERPVADSSVVGSGRTADPGSPGGEESTFPVVKLDSFEIEAGLGVDAFLSRQSAVGLGDHDFLAGPHRVASLGVLAREGAWTLQGNVTRSDPAFVADAVDVSRTRTMALASASARAWWKGIFLGAHASQTAVSRATGRALSYHTLTTFEPMFGFGLPPAIDFASEAVRLRASLSGGWIMGARFEGSALRARDVSGWAWEGNVGVAKPFLAWKGGGLAAFTDVRSGGRSLRYVLNPGPESALPAARVNQRISGVSGLLGVVLAP